MVQRGRLGKGRYGLDRNDGRSFTWFMVASIFLAYVSLSAYEVTAGPDNKRGPSGHALDKIVLSLEDAIGIALKANRNLISSGYSLESGKLNLDLAKSDFDIKTFPDATARVSGGDSASVETYGIGVSLEKKFSSGSLVAVRPGATLSDGSYSGRLGVSLEQPLLRGLGKEYNLDNVYRAEYSLKTSEKSYYLTKVNAVLSAVTAFYEVARQEETLKLNLALANKLYGHAQAARAKEKVGFASPIDVYRAEIQLQNAENSVAETEEAFENAKDNLKTVLALAQNTPIAVKAYFKFDDVSISETEAKSLAMGARVELIQARNDIDEATRNSHLAKHNIIPDLNLVLDYSRFSERDNLSRIGDMNQSEWAVRLVTRSNLARTSEILLYRKSLFNISKVKLQLDKVIDDVKKQVSAQLRALKKSKKQIKNREEQIVQAEGKLELAQIKFNYGMASNFDLIEAEIELQRAHTNKLFGTIDYITGTFKLRAALGTLVEHDMVD